MNEAMGIEEKGANGKVRDNKKPGKMKEFLRKAAKPLAESIAAVATVAVISAGGCALDLTGKYTNDGRVDTTEVQETDEQIEDTQLEDVPVEDVVDGKVDVADGEEDVESEDVSGEDVAEEDVSAEDAVEDVSEGDDPTDVIGADEVELPECDPVDAVRVVTISVGTVELVGNIGVRYNGLISGGGDYDLLCEDVVVESGVTVPVGGVRVVDLSAHGFRTELRVSSADSSSSGVRVAVDAY